MEFIKKQGLILITLVLYSFYFFSIYHLPLIHIKLVAEDHLGDYLQLFSYLASGLILSYYLYKKKRFTVPYLIHWLLALSFFLIAKTDSFLPSKSYYSLAFALLGIGIPGLEFLIKRFADKHFAAFTLNHGFILSLICSAILIEIFSIPQYFMLYKFSELVLSLCFLYLSLSLLEKDLPYKIVSAVLIFALGFSYFDSSESSSLGEVHPDLQITRNLLPHKEYEMGILLYQKYMLKQKDSPYYFGYLPPDNSTRFLLLAYMSFLQGKTDEAYSFLKQANYISAKRLGQYRFLRYIIDRHTHRRQNYFSLQTLMKPYLSNIDIEVGLNYDTIFKHLFDNQPYTKKGLQAELINLYRALYYKQPLNLKEIKRESLQGKLIPSKPQKDPK